MRPRRGADTSLLGYQSTQSSSRKAETSSRALFLALAGTVVVGLLLFSSSGRTAKVSSNTSRGRRLRAEQGQGISEAGTESFTTLSESTGPDTDASLLLAPHGRTAIQLPQAGPLKKKSKKMVALPSDFDWQSYLLYHPELREAGINSEDQAKAHYRLHGTHKKLLFKKIHVIMRYTACTGLVNQLYSHIAALALAANLGAEVVLPPAAKRDSFAHYFSVFKEQNEVIWSAAPLDSLLDVEHLIDFWAQRGLKVRRAQALEPFPDLTEPDRAFVKFTHEGIDERCVARVDGVYLQHLEMGELVNRARHAIVARAEELAATAPHTAIDRFVLDLPCTFFMLRSSSNIRLVAEVAKSLRWPTEVQRLADKVVAGIAAAGDTDFNSVHLRIEKDARDWASIMGGEAVVWSNYMDAMREAGFNIGRGLYIASGLLTYGANEELDHLVATMREAGLCRKAHYKELYLTKSEIEDLNSEQKALLDLLVLAEGYSFVGFGSSTFSYYLREYRTLTGIPPARSILVDASVIGTDALFEDAGRIT